MKLRYYPDTDSLYIDLAERPSADSREVTPGPPGRTDVRPSLESA